jgi:hypothetical protein
VSTLATMALDLLCTFTFPPVGGHDPEDLSDLERAWWQTLINDLKPEEKEQVVAAATKEVSHLRARKTLPKHLHAKLHALESYVAGTMK